MRSLILTLAFFLTFATMSACSKQALNPPDSEIVNSVDAQTFQAQYNSGQLKVGDRVSILKYEDFEKDLKDKRSKTMPLAKKKTVIGEGTVANVLKNNFYELRADDPQHIPENAFIEKL